MEPLTHQLQPKEPLSSATCSGAYASTLRSPSANSWLRYDTVWVAMNYSFTEGGAGPDTGTITLNTFSNLELFSSGLGDALVSNDTSLQITKTLAHTNMGQGGNFGVPSRVYGFALRAGQLFDWDTQNLRQVVDPSLLSDFEDLVKRHLLEHLEVTYITEPEAPTLRAGVAEQLPFYAEVGDLYAPSSVPKIVTTSNDGSPLSYVPFVSPFDPPVGGTKGQTMAVRLSLNVGFQSTITYSQNFTDPNFGTVYIPVTMYLFTEVIG